MNMCMVTDVTQEKSYLTPMVSRGTPMVYGGADTEEEWGGGGGPAVMCLRPGGMRVGMVSCDESGDTGKMFEVQALDVERETQG